MLLVSSCISDFSENAFMPMHFTVTYTKFQNTPEFFAFVYNVQTEKKVFFLARDFIQIRFLLLQSFLVQLKITRETVAARVAWSSVEEIAFVWMRRFLHDIPTSLRFIFKWSQHFSQMRIVMSAFPFLHLHLHSASNVFLRLNGYFYGLSFESFFSSSFDLWGCRKKSDKTKQNRAPTHKVKRSSKMLPLLK